METEAQKIARLKAARKGSGKPIDWKAAQAEWQSQGLGLTAIDRKAVGHLIKE